MQISIPTSFNHELLNALQNAFHYENTRMQILSNLETQAQDESSIHTIAISFTSLTHDTEDPTWGNAIRATEDLAQVAQKFIRDYITKQLKNHDKWHITTSDNGYQNLITGYGYPNKATDYASILITDSTLYITYIQYPQ